MSLIYGQIIFKTSNSRVNLKNEKNLNFIKKIINIYIYIIN